MTLATLAMTKKCSMGSSTGVAGQPDVFWQYRVGVNPRFHERMFDDDWIMSFGKVGSSPTAGRGGSRFLQIDTHELVLRRYRRGGMARTVSDNRYLWQGLTRTRAWREFAVLCELESLELPAPRPYACQVCRLGRTYTATLITYFLPGVTLAEKLCNAELTTSQWQSIGDCIRRFHRAGVFHADLNAHNILLNETQNNAQSGPVSVSLIDFDRARISTPASSNRYERNLRRLKKSLFKIGSSGPLHYNQQCWQALLNGYNKQ